MQGTVEVSRKKGYNDSVYLSFGLQGGMNVSDIDTTV